MSARTITRFAVALLAGLLAACGSGIDGTYLSEGDGFFESLHFKSGGKVEITFMGMTKEGTYELEGKKVKITNAGETQIFTIDDEGALDGGGLIGKYRKAGKASAGKKSTKLSGTYESHFGGEGFRIEFLDEKRVRLTILSGGSEDAEEGTYTTSGDDVRIQVPDGIPLTLKRQGDTLQSTVDGMTITLTRK